MRRIIAALLGLFAAAAPAHAVLINFDDGVQTQAIGGFYSGLGVTFSGAEWVNNFGLVGFSGPNGLGSTSGDGFHWTSATPVVATFSFAVANVSFTAMDLGNNGFTINAYDAAAGGNLVDSMTLFGIGLGNNNAQILGVAAGSIRRVELFQVQQIPTNGEFDGVIVEDFRFTAAPEPGTAALLALGLIGGGVVRGRRAR